MHAESKTLFSDDAVRQTHLSTGPPATTNPRLLAARLVYGVVQRRESLSSTLTAHLADLDDQRQRALVGGTVDPITGGLHHPVAQLTVGIGHRTKLT